MLDIREITALELGLAIRELNAKLAGSYLKKFYDLGNGSFRMSFHNSDGNRIIFCSLLHTLNETGFLEESGAATNFAIAMRKRVEDSKVIGIRQHGSDRIAVVDVQSGGKSHRMVIEMFGRGNLLLLDEEDVIELCYKQISYKDRDIRPRAKYRFPESGALSIADFTDNKIMEIVSEEARSPDKAIVALSRHMNFGPVYLEDIIRSAGCDPKERIGEDSIDALSSAVRRFLSRLDNLSPAAYLKDGEIVDYSVVPLSKYGGFERMEFGSVNEMLDRVNVSARSAVEEDEGIRSALTELEAAMKKQQELVMEFENGSKKYASDAKRIFERMDEINALILRIRELKKPGLEELKREFPSLNVSGIDLQHKTVQIEA